MQAPDWETLHNFEEIFENAAAGVIAAADLPALTARSLEEAPELFAAVEFSPGPATGSMQLVNGTAEYDRYTGTLEIQVRASRLFDDGSDVPDIVTKLAEVRAKLRAIFRQSQWPLNDENLKYYRVSRLRPDGTTSGITQDKMLDLSTLRFVVEFGIMPDAWPA